MIVSTILSELEDLPEQAPNISNDTVISERDLEGAYIVLGGTGWTKKNFFIEELHDWVNTKHHVRVIRFEEFMGKANKGKL